eukprot:5645013-Pleurochrysis_carterae.AAC.1
MSRRRSCLRRCRSCAVVGLGGGVGVRHGRKVETRISMFVLIVDLVSVGRFDGVDQGEVHPDAVDVYDLIACLSGWRSRTDRQVCHLEALRVVLAVVLDTFHLLLVLEDLVRQKSGAPRVAAWVARIHLVVCEMARAF